MSNKTVIVAPGLLTIALGVALGLCVAADDGALGPAATGAELAPVTENQPEASPALAPALEFQPK